jgi:hypothetical protein
MRSRRIIGLVILLSYVPSARADFRYGLGNAVAHRSAELINKAGASQVGDLFAATLPSCSASPFYTVAPVSASNITGMVPLGNLAPTGHVFPSDHTYLYLMAGTYSVYAPGDTYITDIATVNHPGLGFTNYVLYLYSCRDVKMYMGNINTLSAAVNAQMASYSNSNCQTYTTGGVTESRCDLQTAIPVHAGDLLGTMSGTLDWGTYDYRKTQLFFASPSRHYTDLFYDACPLDYFTPSSVAGLKAKLGYFSGPPPFYDGSSTCGTIQNDVANTAAGDWFKPGQPDNPEDPHLALVHDNVRTTWEDVNIGASGPGPSATELFTPTSSGLVDRDFTQVTNDGQIYCYDTFRDLASGNPQQGLNFVYLIQLTSQTTIRIDRQTAANCGAGPWSFSGTAVDYQR